MRIRFLIKIIYKGSVAWFRKTFYFNFDTISVRKNDQLLVIHIYNRESMRLASITDEILV